MFVLKMERVEAILYVGTWGLLFLVLGVFLSVYSTDKYWSHTWEEPLYGVLIGLSAVGIVSSFVVRAKAEWHIRSKMIYAFVGPFGLLQQLLAFLTVANFYLAAFRGLASSSASTLLGDEIQYCIQKGDVATKIVFYFIGGCGFFVLMCRSFMPYYVTEDDTVLHPIICLLDFCFALACFATAQSYQEMGSLTMYTSITSGASAVVPSSGIIHDVIILMIGVALFTTICNCFIFDTDKLPEDPPTLLVRTARAVASASLLLTFWVAVFANKQWGLVIDGVECIDKWSTGVKPPIVRDNLAVQVGLGVLLFTGFVSIGICVWNIRKKESSAREKQPLVDKPRAQFHL